MYHYLFSLEKY